MKIIIPNLMDYFTLILLAGGKGTRMGGPLPKQFLSLQGKPIALYSLELFLLFSEIQEIIIVCDPAYRHLFPHPKVSFADPGKERQDSVWNGALRASPKSTRLIIHDSARPFLEPAHLSTLLEASTLYPALASAVPLKATIKQATADNIVEKTLNRAYLWEVHTPQIIAPALYKEAALFAQSHNLTLTDDVALVELLGHPVKLIPGSYKNIKITTPEDLPLAEKFLHAYL